MRTHARTATTRCPRAFRPSEVKDAAARRAEHHSAARMDPTTLAGPSQIERGDITRLDPRTAVALRAAIDGAIYDVAQRFNLAYAVVRDQADGEGVDVRVRLVVKAFRRAMSAR
jgi:hypothetical protein